MSDDTDDTDNTRDTDGRRGPDGGGEMHDSGAVEPIGERSPAVEASVLDTLEAAFRMMCAGPHPISLDTDAAREVCAVEATSRAPVALDVLRERLLVPGTAQPVRDRVWAALIERARTGDACWTVACAGMARPLLTGVVRELTRGLAGDGSDISCEVLAGFLVGLRMIDPYGTPVLALRWAAWRAGHAALRAQLDAPRPMPPHTTTRDLDSAVTERGVTERGPGGPSRRGSGPPPAWSGHPDLVLAEAVTAGVLTHAEAALIGTTRLEPITLVQAAAALGVPLATVTSERYRAEGRLLTHLAPTHPTPDPTGRAGEVVASGRADQTAAETPRGPDRTGPGEPGSSARPSARTSARRAIRARALEASSGGTHRRRRRPRRDPLTDAGAQPTQPTQPTEPAGSVRRDETQELR